MNKPKYKLYSASWCNNCTPMKLWLKQMAVDFEVVNIDDEDQDVLDSYPIKALPTLTDDVSVLAVGDNIKKFILEGE